MLEVYRIKFCSLAYVAEMAIYSECDLINKQLLKLSGLKLKEMNKKELKLMHKKWLTRINLSAIFYV
jgi:hypothetical protein